MKRIYLIISILLWGGLMTACQPSDPTPTPTEEPTESAPEPTPTDFGAEETSTDDDDANDTNRPDALVRLNLYPAQTIDPGTVTPLDATGLDIVSNVFAGLARVNTETGVVEPYLADRWEKQADNVTWHVFLRDDINWVQIDPDSGEMVIQRAVTADDVVNAVRRACQGGSGAPVGSTPLIFLIEGCGAIYQLAPDVVTAELVADRVGVRVLNETAVAFTLTRDTALLPTLLTMPMLYPQPSERRAEFGDGWISPDTVWTSGPFVIQPGIPSEEGYTLVTNDYWPLERSGNVATVQISFSDVSEAYQAWADENLGVVSVPAADVGVPPFGETPAFRLMGQDAALFWVAHYETAPLDDPLVRQALSLALSRQTVINEAWEPTGQTAIPAFGLVPPGVIAAPPYGSIGGYDPSLAQDKLAQAGYPNCEGLPPITLLVDASFTAWPDVAAASVSSWQEQLGCSDDQFSVEVYPAEQRTDLQNLLKSPNRDGSPRPALVLLAWQADYPDAYHWLADIIGCQTFFPDAYLDQGRDCVDADSELQQSSGLEDDIARAESLQAISEAFFGVDGEMPLIPIAYYARPLAINPWVEVYPLHAGPLRFDTWIIHAE